MPKTRKLVTLDHATPCEFCKGKIAAGEKRMIVAVKDSFGKFKLHYHVECNRTADLNASTEWGV